MASCDATLRNMQEAERLFQHLRERTSQAIIEAIDQQILHGDGAPMGHVPPSAPLVQQRPAQPMHFGGGLMRMVNRDAPPATVTPEGMTVLQAAAQLMTSTGISLSEATILVEAARKPVMPPPASKPPKPETFERKKRRIRLE